MIVVGLDPGKDTGVAIFVDGTLRELRTIEPTDIREILIEVSPSLVVFEDSNLISHMYNAIPRMASTQVKCKISRDVGGVDSWCKLIMAECKKQGIKFIGISAKQKGKKLNAAEFNVMTGWQGTSNQHTRDAGVVALPYRRAKV